ncbi:MAG: HPr family phosphocarrier protein [Alicyclobacillus sp.]|nr:HPr family phosphocarrier protein [Alicyclobacillus sp.]
MAEKRVVVKLRSGLLARPAALFVQEANRFSCEIFVEKDGKSVNAKSIMGIMSLAIAHGQEVVIKADGSDAEQAVSRLAEMIAKDE